MSLKLRLIAMNFLQFFVWGAWLITIGAYWFQNRHWSGAQFGAIFSTMGIASLFMPSITGVIADKWIRAERLYGGLHIAGAVVLCIVPMINDPSTLFWVMLVNMMCYMPTISLSITVAYNALKGDGVDVVRVYPPIRVWGTVGFIVAMWTVSLLHLETTTGQFYVAAAAALVLGLLCLYAAALSAALARQRSSLVAGRARAYLFRAVQEQQDGHLFHLRHAARRGAAVDQCLWRYLSARLRQSRCLQRPDRGALPRHHHVDFAGVGNAVHLGHSVLSETLRHQDGDADQHACVDAALRLVCLRRPGRRSMDDCACRASSTAWRSISSTSPARCLSKARATQQFAPARKVCSC